jgi:hypothetical protein
MLTTILIAAAALQAQTPAPASAPVAPAAAATKLGLDTPVEELVANPKTKAVLDAELPTLAAHPSYELFKAMSLRQLAPMSQGALTDEMLQKLEPKLAAAQ